MEDIRVYDTDFKLLHIEKDIISANWTIYFNDIGSFEIHTLADTELGEIILENLDIENSKLPVIVQGDQQGIVTGIRLSEDLAIYGKTCNWLLSKKVVPKFISTDLSVEQTPEGIARKLVKQAFYDQENFILGEKKGFETIDSFWRNTYNILSEVVKDVLALKNAGHNLFFDIKNKKWVFNVVPPNRSKLILSEANKNAFGSEYTYSVGDYFSACWYEQEQDFVNGEFPEPIWTLYVKDNKSGIFRNECVSYATVQSEAESFIENKKISSELVTKPCMLNLGEDYHLGDILRTQFTRGRIKRTFLKQISGISIGFEAGESTTEVILKNIKE